MPTTLPTPSRHPGLSVPAPGCLATPLSVPSLRQTGARRTTSLAAPLLQPPPPGTDRRVGEAAGSLFVLPDFLVPACFQALHEEAATLTAVERSHVPLHKKGGTVAYGTLCRQAPGLVAFYHDAGLQDAVSRRVGCAVRPTPLHDQNSLSLLVYDRPGDRIGWHHDHNFYRGRHFTLLVPLVNRGSAAQGLSHACLLVREAGRPDRVLGTGANQAVLFEGAKVLHRVSPILTGERRVILSMTFCADSHATRLQALSRRIKDIAYFGLRALWT